MAATISIQPTAALTDGCSAVCPSYYSGTGSYSSSPSAGKFAFTNYQLTATATTGWRVKRVIFHTSWDASDGSSGTRKYTFRNSDNVNPYVIPETQKYTLEWPYDFSETDPGDEWRLRTTLETITDIEVLFEVGPTPPPSVKVVSAYASPSDGGTVQVGSDDSGTSSSYAVEIGGSVNIVATPASGYVFKGWYLGSTLVSSSAAYTVSNVTSDQTFEARFVPVYTIRVVTFSSRGTVSLTDGTDDSDLGFNVKTRVVESGTQVTIGAYSNNASIWPFKAWYRDPYAWGDPERTGTLVPGAGSQYTTTVTANVTYFATFQQPVYVGVSAAGDYGAPVVSLTINGNVVSDLEVPADSSVTISAPIDGGVPTSSQFVDAHYYFSHWANQYGEVLSTNSSYTFQSGAWGSEHIYVAHYKTYLRLNTAVDPNSSAGTISVSPPSSHGDYYELGTSITLTATANTGWTFRKWVSSSGEESAASTLSLDVSDIDGVTWTAYFLEPGYSVITTVVSPQSEASRTTLTGAGTYQNGSQCTIEATPLYPGMTKFGVWQSDSGEISRDNPLTFEVTQDDTWTAYMIGAPSSYYILLTFVEPKEMGYVDGGTIHVFHNEHPILYAHANPGYRFVKWVSSDGTIVTHDYLSYAEYYNQYTWTAYFEYDGTDLLVNSSSLGSPVKLVYDDRSGGTGLLVADY